MNAPTCRFCATALRHTFADLGMSPLSNAFVPAADARRREVFYPLHAWVCHGCLLVQLEEFESPEQIFKDYPYFSSYSESWLSHCEDYTRTMRERLALGPESLVVEVASNDGYLLQYFVGEGIPVLGIEPAANVAHAATGRGVPTLTAFFGTSLAQRLVAQGRQADLLIGNNVLAHVPALNDFVAGLRVLLKPEGVITMEFPHLWRLMRETQFDTIYHEHFSYFSFLVVERLFATHGLTIFDVQELPTHGGSLRIHARHTHTPHAPARPVTPAVAQLREREIAAGMDRLDTYRAFADQVKAVKRALLQFLLDARSAGKHVVGYGAPAKGVTLLNYCGVREDLLDYTVDRSPHKQGTLLPGVRIPVYAPERIFETRPDYVLILPWNLQAEITAQMAGIGQWGGRFVVPIPAATLLD